MTGMVERMFPQFGMTTESLNRASTLVFRIASDAHLYDDPEDVNVPDLLDSKFDSDKSEALKRLLALIAQGVDVSSFYPLVVKNVASPSLEVKKLVYLYLLHYAEKHSNEALLSINCFQKDLSDPNPSIRAWALRAMTGIRLHAIAPLLLLAVNKCARDPAPYVRKCAAIALSKIFALQNLENNFALEELVGTFFADSSPSVIGAAAAAFQSICPNNMVLIGRFFRRLCEALPDVEEWGQIIMIGILLRYVVARHGLVRDSLLCSLCNLQGSACESSTNISGYSGFMKFNSTVVATLLKYYLDEMEYLSEVNDTSKMVHDLNSIVLTSSHNSDVKLLLQCTLPLLWSRNSAVVLAASGIYWIMATLENIHRIVNPLLFLLRSSAASRHVVLCNIQVFAKVMPSLFEAHFEDFFVSSFDSYEVKVLKLDILSTIVSDISVQAVLQECQDYVKDCDRRFAANTVAMIGTCGRKLSGMAETCLGYLLSLIKQECSVCCWEGTGSEECVLIHAINAVKGIVNESPASHVKVIVQLARSLDIIKVPEARAIIIWMIGEYHNISQGSAIIMPSLVRYLACCFPREVSRTKIRILNACMKVILCSKNGCLSLYEKSLSHLFEMGKRDATYYVRDHARLIWRLLSFQAVVQEKTSDLSSSSRIVKELTCSLLGKKTCLPCFQSHGMRFYLPGSLSQLVMHAALGYMPLPKPCDYILDEVDQLQQLERLEQETSSSSGTNDPGMVNGSAGSDSGFDLQSTNETESKTIGDNEKNCIATDVGSSWINEPSVYDGLPLSSVKNIMPDRSIESWLNEQSIVTVNKSSTENNVGCSLGCMGIVNVDVTLMPTRHPLLDPSNGNGLMVEYSFTSEASRISSLLVCIDVHFENCTSELLEQISVEEYGVDAEMMSEVPQSSKTAGGMLKIVPTDVIESLGPGLGTTRLLQVHFPHHLLPVKVSVSCNAKRYPVKLWPNIGYFIKPLHINTVEFMRKESQLRGMFENTRRCGFRHHVTETNEFDDQVDVDIFPWICQKLASKVLSNSNFFLVSLGASGTHQKGNASGLCLRFSGELLSCALCCLLTIDVADGSCFEPLKLVIKVNCEDTIFGLNLLNRVVSFLD